MQKALYLLKGCLQQNNNFTLILNPMGKSLYFSSMHLNVTANAIRAITNATLIFFLVSLFCLLYLPTSKG